MRIDALAEAQKLWEQGHKEPHPEATALPAPDKAISGSVA